MTTHKRRRPSAIALSVAAASVLALSSFVAPSSADSASSVPAASESFFAYDGSAPLESFEPGAVLKTRTFSYRLLGIPTPVKVAQIVYRTTDQLGRPAANVTSVLLPPTGTPTKAVSYQSAYDSNDIADAPSRAIAGNQTIPGIAAAGEAAAMTSFVAAGVAVVIPDDEGADSVFGMGRQYGQVTLDSLRAALNGSDVTRLGPTTKIGMLGYSGGAIATGWAAQLQPSYAPELTPNLVGAAYGGVTVNPAHTLAYVSNTPLWSVIIPTALAGAVKAYNIDWNKYASPYGIKLLEQARDRSIAYNVGFSAFASWQKMVKPEYANPNSVPEFLRVTNENNMGLAPAPTMPILMAQGGGGILNGTPPSAKYGTGDGVMLVKDARTLVRNFCATGTKVLFREYPLFEHATAGAALFGEGIPWLYDRLNGKPAPTNCASVPAGNSLAAEQPVPVGSPAP